MKNMSGGKGGAINLYAKIMMSYLIDYIPDGYTKRAYKFRVIIVLVGQATHLKITFIFVNFVTENLSLGCLQLIIFVKIPDNL